MSENPSPQNGFTGSARLADSALSPAAALFPDTAPRSQELFARALAVTPGGVNSPVRAFRAVGGTPRFMVAGRGAYLTDADGREYVDLVCSWGPIILGHAHPAVVEALQTAASRGTSFGTPSRGEVELAELIVASVPLLTRRTCSTGPTRSTMRSASSTSPGLGVP